MSELKRCPKCGCSDGFYTKEWQQILMFYHFGEQEPFESEQGTNGKGGNAMYCIACDAKIGLIKTVKR